MREQLALAPKEEERVLEAALDEARKTLGSLGTLTELLADQYKAEKALANVRRSDVKAPEDYERLGTWLRLAKDESARIEERRVANTRPLYSLWKYLNDVLGRPVKTYELVFREINAKLNAYEAEQERRARERQEQIRRIQEEEARRIEAEAQKAAAEAMRQGDRELAQEILDTAQPPIPVVVAAKVPPKVEGIRRVERWVAMVDDVSKVPDEYVERVPKMKQLHALAAASEGRNPPPGVRFVKDVTRGKSG